MALVKKIIKLLSNPIVLIPFNLAIASAAVIANMYMQVFCVPVKWAAILLVICFFNVIFSPLYSNLKALHPLLGFLNGLSFFICLYCIIFLGSYVYVGLFAMLFGVGILIFIPHFFASQIFYRNFIDPDSANLKRYFIIGLVTCIALSAFIGWQYNREIKNFKAFAQSNFEVLNKSPMTEKILGMHFIYHTKICIYDGWRPPMHDPMLVMGMWLNGGEDPLKVNLGTRIELYKNFYPERKIKKECSCAKYEHYNYHSDPRLQ